MGKRLIIKGADFSEVCIGSATVAAPVFTPASGQYNSVLVLLSSVSTGASIYYTTDGSTPTSASTLYSGGITIDTVGLHTIKAIAVKNGISSEVSTATYDIVEEVIEPTAVTISGGEGTQTGSTVQLTATVTPSGASQSVTWSIVSGNATVNSSGLVTLADGETTATVVVRATSSSYPSVYAEKTISFAVVLPTAPTITVSDTGTVEMASADDLTIYYTTDGTTPTSSSSVYSGAITPSAGATTFKARCIANGAQSAVTTRNVMKYTQNNCTVQNYGVRATSSPYGITSFTQWNSTPLIPLSGYANTLFYHNIQASSFGAIYYSSNEGCTDTSDSQSSIITDSGVKFASGGTATYVTVRKQHPANAQYMRFCRNAGSGYWGNATVILYD